MRNENVTSLDVDRTPCKVGSRVARSGCDPVKVGEGGANVLYLTQDGCVRVSKIGRPAAETIKYWNIWRVRLGRFMSPMTLVDDSNHGEVVQMEYVGRDGILAEFKPKWLLQSPDAPADAVSCRTCAVNAMRGKAGVCPLRLLRREDLSQAVAELGATEPAACARYLAQCRLLEDLRGCQAGAPSVNCPAEEMSALCDAMSVRDCTVLVEKSSVPWSSSSYYDAELGVYIRARLVDLDPKSPSKLEGWRRLEHELQHFYRRSHSCALHAGRGG